MLTGWTATDMHGRTALVTGANSGISFRQALELADLGSVQRLADQLPGRGLAPTTWGTSRSPGACFSTMPGP